jgi:hypothetical protein
VAVAGGAGGQLVKHARHYWRLLAESPLTRPTPGSDAAADRVATLGGGVAVLSDADEREDRASRPATPFGEERLCLMEVALFPQFASLELLHPLQYLTLGKQAQRGVTSPTTQRWLRSPSDFRTDTMCLSSRAASPLRE